MNAWSILTVHCQKHASLKSAKILVPVASGVVPGPNVGLSNINLYATAHQGCKATLWFPAQKWVVDPTTIVLSMKSVTSQGLQVPPKNACVSAIGARVFQGRHVELKITEKLALAIIHFKEMVLCLVRKVSEGLLSIHQRNSCRVHSVFAHFCFPNV